MPSNFKTYEAQSRLLAAVLASNPDMKLNFKAIALHYGSDVTVSGMEHRLRPIKKQVNVIRQAVAQGMDAKDFANVVGMNGKEIAKHYGESTPQGIEFQFRDVKKHAKALKDAVANGESPLTARSNVAVTGSTIATPKGKRAAGAVAATPRTKSSTSKAKRVKHEVDSNEDTEDVDYEALDVTPTRPKKQQKVAAPANAAAVPLPATPTHAASAGHGYTVPAAAPTPSLTLEGTPSEDDDFTIIEPPSQPSMPTFSTNDFNPFKGETTAWSQDVGDSFVGGSDMEGSSAFHTQFLEPGEV